MGRDVVIAGNWKMYKTGEEAASFIQELAGKVEEAQVKVFIAPPYTAIKEAADAAKGTKIEIGGQNMNDATEGAFTGEIAGKMLLNSGAQFVILGHSERRHIFGESNEFVNRKVKRALEVGLQPILCIGETIEQREADQTESVLEEQLTQSLADITPEQMNQIIIAYEPVWAIGTGHTATPEQAQDMHKFCRKVVSTNWKADPVILYGGSVKPENVKTLMDQLDIDGVLVGGASLTVDSFSQIVNYQTINV